MEESELRLRLRDSVCEVLRATPDHVVELRRSDAPAGTPRELDILVFSPTQGERSTRFATAGLGLVQPPGQPERVELTLELLGKLEDDERQVLARQLGDVAVLPFAYDIPLEPRVILENASLRGFERMPNLLVVDLRHPVPTYLPRISPAVRMLSLLPIYDQELTVVSYVDSAACRLMLGSVDFADGARRPFQPRPTQ